MIDLSLVPSPDVLEALNYEDLLAARKARLIAAMPVDQRAAVTATLALESEPLTKLLEENTYEVMVLRQRVNDAARAVMLAHAVGTDLDNLAANLGVQRLVIAPADPDAVPPNDAVMESDADLRERALLSLDAYATAGSSASYRFHAKSASGQVLDVSVESPTPGYVTLYVLSRTDQGEASEDLLAAVTAALSAETVRPLTDHLTVLSASIVTYTIEATLYVDRGSDPTVVRDNAVTAAQAYADKVHRLAAGASISGIYGAIHQPGVLRAELSTPAANVTVSAGQAAFCTAITLTAVVEP
ncbi:baseplate J/gp47 family protein [Comamonadaceae bacterium PP-2]